MNFNIIMSFFDKHKHSLFNNQINDDFVIPVNPIDLLNFKPKEGIQLPLQTGGGGAKAGKNNQEHYIKKNEEFVKACRSQHKNAYIIKKSCYNIAGFNIDA